MTYMGDVSNTTAAQQRLTAVRMSVCLQTALQTNETPTKLPERRSVKRARESDSHLWKMLDEENQKSSSLDPNSNNSRNLRVRVPVSLGTMAHFRRLPTQPNSQLLLLVNSTLGKQIQTQLVAIVCAWSGMCLHLASVPSASAADGIDDAIRESFRNARSAAQALGVTAETVTDDVPVMKTSQSDGSCSWPGAQVFWSALRAHEDSSSSHAASPGAHCVNAYRWPRPAVLHDFMTTWNTSPSSLSALLRQALHASAAGHLGAQEWQASLAAAANSASGVHATSIPQDITPQALWVAGIRAGGAAAPPATPLGGTHLLPAALQPSQPSKVVFPVAPEQRSLAHTASMSTTCISDDVSLDSRARVASCSDVGAPGAWLATAHGSGASSPWCGNGLANPMTPDAASPPSSWMGGAAADDDADLSLM